MNHINNELSLQMILEVKQEIINSDVIDCGIRLNLVEQCIYISFEHAIGVNSLQLANLQIQALILLRSQFEAVVKAYWLLFLAPNDKISELIFNYTYEEQFQKDNLPGIGDMLKRLSSANLEARGVINQLINFQNYHLKKLHSFVHTGKQSFIRSEVGFDEEMTLKLMKLSNNLITIAAQIMLKHTVPDKQKYIYYIIEKYRNCFCLDGDEFH